MTTATDILTASARALGYLGRGEVLTASDANDAVLAFNRMLDSWSTEFLVSFANVTVNFPLVIGQQTYTIGASGQINATRPIDIIQAYIRDTNSNDYPINIIPQNQWNNIGTKYITSQIPDTMFYDSQYPLGIINIFPVPLLTYTVYIDYSINQVDMSTLTQVLSLPVGYERAYVFNLALDMMSMGFPCMLDEKGLARLTANAMEAKGNIKRANMKQVIAQYDPSIVSRSNATYNVFSDSTPRS
jgi:hypothetical protein